MIKLYTHQGIIHFKSVETLHWKQQSIALRKTTNGWESGRGTKPYQFNANGMHKSGCYIDLNSIKSS